MITQQRWRYIATATTKSQRRDYRHSRYMHILTRKLDYKIASNWPKINRYFDEQLGKDELSSIELGGA